MSQKGASVVMAHNSKEYKGKQYDSYTGVIKIKGKEYLLKTQCEEGSDEITMYEGKEKGNSLFYINVFELKPQSQRKQKNEL